MSMQQGMGRLRAAALSIGAATVSVSALVAAAPSAGAVTADDYRPGECISNDGIDPHPFTDVPDGSFYADAVAWLYSNGITVGVSPTQYGSEQPVTRGQFATMLHRMACLPAPTGTATFVDLRPGAYYRDAVDWMVGEGITVGKTPTRFGPDDLMTRGEFATFLFRLAGEPDSAPLATNFVDNDRERFFARPVDWLVYRSVTQGTSPTTFSPERSISRAEVATFLYRLNTIGDVALGLVPVVTGLSAPTAGALDPTTGDVYVASRDGLVTRYPAGADGHPNFGAGGVVLDVDAANAVISGGERGLLGLAVAPDGDHLYASFTADADSGLGVTDGDSVIVEYGLAGGVVDAASRRLVIAVPQLAANHNGGQVVFGPDGYLYTSFGDGGGANDPGNNGQNVDTLLGSILRLDVSTSPAYAVPADNPFVGVAGADEIWLYGVRNPWRFTFDRDIGDLWVADVGQGNREDVSRLAAHLAGGRGANLGWRLREGTIATPGVGGPEPPGHVGPVHDYPNPSEGCSVTGGYAYRGSDIPALDGVYVYSDYCNPALRGWRDAFGIEAVDFDLSVPGGNPSSFFEDAAGELYGVSLNGTISRLVRSVA